MKIIKPYGRSIVERKDNKFERFLDVKGLARNTTRNINNTQKVGNYLKADEAFFISQWISMLDKILKKTSDKPKTRNRKVTEQMWNTRNKAGEAFFALWRNNREKLASFISRFTLFNKSAMKSGIN